ncbi:MAG: CBS domain-containing protein, partial [bacterium]
MKTVKAEDIMIPIEEYPHISDKATLREALHEFEKHQFDIKGKKSLPRVILVFDELNTFVGIVRRRDILRGLEPESLQRKPLKVRKMLFDVEIDPNLSELSYERMIT